MRGIKQMLMGIVLLLAGLMVDRYFPAVGLIPAVVGLGFAVVGFMPDSTDEK